MCLYIEYLSKLITIVTIQNKYRDEAIIRYRDNTCKRKLKYGCDLWEIINGRLRYTIFYATILIYLFLI